jgi:pSer/pThr/pTyr-binding forkhead associated (FHA) protein
MPVCHIYNSMGMRLVRFSTEHYAHSGRIMVGRSSHCTISLKAYAESYISREHFLLEKKMGAWHISDRSYIGIVKNAVKIKGALLEIGDVIRFGQLFFCFGEKTGPSFYDLAWDAESINADGRAVLWPGVNSVGASADNYVTIRQGEVSRFHGKITVNGDNLTYENSNRNIKTFVNGALMELVPVAFNTRTRIVLGDTPIRLQKMTRISSDLSGGLGVAGSAKEELTLEAAIAMQKSLRPRLPVVVVCLILLSVGFLLFLMIMLYILFY